MYGIHTALVTPFQDDGSLDLEAYEALAARQLDAGIHGLVACGTTGETPTLSMEEWGQVVSATVAVSEGKVPVTAGVGTNNTATSVANCHAAKEIGADAGLLVFPYYNKPNPAGLRAHVASCLQPGLPLVLYHVPGRTGQMVPASLIAELASLDGVIGVKEATGDMRFGSQVMAGTSTAVLSGDDFSFLGLMAQGGAGCVSVVSNVAPAQTVALYNAFRSGDRERATALLHQLWPLIELLFSDSNPVPCKAALADLGLCGSSVRAPLASWSGESVSNVVQAALQ